MTSIRYFGFVIIENVRTRTFHKGNIDFYRGKHTIRYINYNLDTSIIIIYVSIVYLGTYCESVILDRKLIFAKRYSHVSAVRLLVHTHW